MPPMVEQLAHALHSAGLQGPRGCHLLAQYLAAYVRSQPAGTQRVLVAGLRAALRVPAAPAVPLQEEATATQ